jgi:hypothetical protein
MGFFKNLIFEDDGKEKISKPLDKRGSNKLEHNVPKTESQYIAPPQRVISPTPSTKALDPEIMGSLSKALEAANMEGFDYFEFTKILDQLSSAIPGEQMRYQAAFASAVAMGTSKQRLLETAEHYISTLKAESENFSVMVEEQMQTNVISKESAIISADTQIKEKSILIGQLTAEINELSNYKQNMVEEITLNKSKIIKIQSDFSSCLDMFVGKIKNDIENIIKYIQS